MPEIIVHDAYGFTQALRRALFLAVMEQEIAQAAVAGQTITYSEEPDGFTVYVDGACNLTAGTKVPQLCHSSRTDEGDLSGRVTPERPTGPGMAALVGCSSPACMPLTAYASMAASTEHLTVAPQGVPLVCREESISLFVTDTTPKDRRMKPGSVPPLSINRRGVHGLKPDLYDSRTTYAELAALETDPEAILRGLR